jgi:single-strand DNA-binding protein
MNMNFNLVVLTGHLTRDPELRTLPGGSTVCDFGLANNRKWTDGGGNKKEETLFVDCSAWGKTGENIRQYFAKGNPILISGRLTYESWEKDGVKRSRLKITVERFDFVGSKKEESESQPIQSAPQTEAQPSDATPDDEIPF